MKNARMFRLRLLPLTMFAAFMLLAVKLADCVRGGQEFTQAFLIGSVEAQQPQAGAATPAPPTPPAPAVKAPATPAAAAASSAAAPPSEAAKPSEAQPEPSQTPGDADNCEGGRGLAPGARVFSPTELAILENLSKRREQLDQREKDIAIKENLLSATEQRIDDKIAQVDAMKKELTNMISVYNNEQDAKIKSLVKIYENMKPADAARIFDEVEMPILLLVIDRMAEKKASPILAAMDPNKAKQLTVALAEERRIQSTKLNAAQGVATAPAPSVPATPPAAPPSAPASMIPPSMPQAAPKTP